LPGLGQQRLDLPAFEFLAGAQAWRQRPMIQLRQGVRQHGFGQPVDAQQQRAGIVLAAALVGEIDQGAGRRGQVRLVVQYVCEILLGDARPDAVAQQHEAVAFVQVAVQVVHQ